MWGEEHASERGRWHGNTRQHNVCVSLTPPVAGDELELELLPRKSFRFIGRRPTQKYTDRRGND